MRTIITFIRVAWYLLWTQGRLHKAKKFDKQGNFVERDKIVQYQVPLWARSIIDLTKSTVEISGEENLPKDTACVFIANHQGMMDIPVILGYIKKPTAFMAKIEILKVPVLSGWMKMMQCTFLDRKNMRQSVGAMHEAIESVKKGYSLVIFPEGTRSRGGPCHEFKAGSFKLAFQSGCPIVPITIDGSWQIFEETGKIKNGNIKITIHESIPTANLTRDEQKVIPAKVAEIITKQLPPPREIVQKKKR